MKDSLFGIVPFLIVDLKDNDVVVMTESNIVNIDETYMIDFFNSIEEYGKTVLDYDYIYSFFEENTYEAIEFLMSNKLIYKKDKHKYNYDKITFLTNNQTINDMLIMNLDGVELDYCVKYSNSILDIINSLKNADSKNDYHIVIMNPFNLIDLHKITRVSKELNLTIKVIFLYNYSFYFTNIYKDSWGTPCPVCFFSNLESTLRGEAKFNEYTSFQTIMDIVYSKKESFSVQFNYKPYQLVHLISYILKEVKKIEESEINLVKKLNMQNFNIEYDTSYHWEMCNCYEQ